VFRLEFKSRRSDSWELSIKHDTLSHVIDRAEGLAKRVDFVRIKGKSGIIHGCWYKGENMSFLVTESKHTTTPLTEGKIEAYGVKGFASTKWRKTFKDYEAAEKWAEANNAEIEGTRDLEE
jgi:hypothetical protein